MKKLALMMLVLPLAACTDEGPSTDEIGTETTSESTGESSGSESESSGSESTESTDTTESTSTTESTDTTDTTDTSESTSETTGGPLCGDGVIDVGEECDDGPANADDAACTSTCALAICGDGLVLAGSEACDTMGESAECNADCSAAACGDGTLNLTAGEVCDGDVGMVGCVDEGFLGGELTCSMACDYDTSGCFLDFTATFTNCGQTGHTGPSQAQCDMAYTNTSLAGDVTVTAGYQTWTVPFTATYSIEVWGAQGGNHNFGAGGQGARVKGDFDLVQGDVLQILVGQKGKDGTAYDVGGGGGTFVVRDDDTPLIIAGGGGGAGNCGGGFNLAQMIGKALAGDGTGGTGSNDGNYCGCGGAGSPGGGFSSDGMPSGGKSFLSTGLGDNTERPSQCVDSGLGGFGGGGNGGNGGGGGGGYEGGDAGGFNGLVAGQGGESYNTGANTQGQDGVRQGHGQVVITLLP